MRYFTLIFTLRIFLNSDDDESGRLHKNTSQKDEKCPDSQSSAAHNKFKETNYADCKGQLTLRANITPRTRAKSSYVSNKRRDKLTPEIHAALSNFGVACTKKNQLIHFLRTD
jgi:hypothetical protein